MRTSILVESGSSLTISGIRDSRTFITSIVKGAAFLSIGKGISSLCGFAFRYILIHIWTPDEYGVLTLIMTVINLLGVCTEFDLNATTTIFLAKDIRNPGNKRILVEILCVFALLVSFSLIVTFAVSYLCNLDFPALDVFRQYFASIWLLVIVTGITALGCGLLRAHKRMGYEAGSQIARGMSLLGLTLAAVYVFSKKSIEIFVDILIISQVFCFLVVMFFILRKNMISLESRGMFKDFWRYLRGISFSRVRSIFTFSFRLNCIGIPLIILLSVDKLMISWLLSTEMLGFYGVAFLIVIIPRMITHTFATALQPHVAERSADIKEAKKRYLTFLVLFSSLAIIGYGLLTFFAQYTLLLFDEKYRWITPVIQILLIGMFCLDIFSLNATFISSLMNMKILKQIVVAIFIVILINITLNYLLIPKLGIEGAALATTIAFMIIGTASMIQVSRLRVSEREAIA